MTSTLEHPAGDLYAEQGLPPPTPENYDHPGTYIAESIRLLSNPRPSPEHPTTQDRATTIADAFVANRWYRPEFLEGLHDAYVVPEDDAKRSGPVNEYQAGQNLVCAVLLELQHRALEWDDRDLLVCVTMTACELVNKEVFDSGVVAYETSATNAEAYNFASNRLLTAVLESSIARHEELQRQGAKATYGGAVREREGLFSIHDSDYLQGALECLLLSGNLEFKHPETLQFMLEQYGLDPQRILDAWCVGYVHEPWPENFLQSDAVRENMLSIVQLEGLRPGASSRLHQLNNNSICCFARRSTKYWDYMDEPLRKGWENCQQPCLLVLTAQLDDELNALCGQVGFDHLLDAVKASGHRMVECEWSSGEEKRALEIANSWRFPKIIQALWIAHSNIMAMAPGLVRDSERQGVWRPVVYDKRGVQADEAHLQRVYKYVRKITLAGCEAGLSGGFLDSVKCAIRNNVPVVGFRHITGAKFSYTAEKGLKMRGAATINPTPAEARARLNLPLWYRLSRFAVPSVVSRRTMLNEEQETAFREIQSFRARTAGL